MITSSKRRRRGARAPRIEPVPEEPVPVVEPPTAVATEYRLRHGEPVEFVELDDGTYRWPATRG